MNKYVVLARYLDDGVIANSFGVFRKEANAHKRMLEVMDENFEYCVEEVDPCGSYANDNCED